jgi:hypothetical protein
MPLVSDDRSCEPPVFQLSFPLQDSCQASMILTTFGVIGVGSGFGSGLPFFFASISFFTAAA